MKRSISYLFLAAASLCGLASAQTTAYTTPVGYVSVTCTNNADTRVGLPLMPPAVAAAALTTNPVGGLLTVSTAAFGTYANTHYVKFTGTGAASGKIYAITANTATTITIDLNGDTLTAVSGDTFSVTAFWTLKTLFDPALSTNNPLTTQNGIVGSLTSLTGARRTQIYLPSSSSGTNLASRVPFFIDLSSGTWKDTANLSIADAGGQQIWPDSSFIIRNPASVTSPTTYVCSGEVDMGKVVIPLATRSGGLQDNHRALNRPVDVTLNQLNLAGTSAFVSSNGQLTGARRDLLLVWTGTRTINQAPTATYFFNSQTGTWNIPGSINDAGGAVIPAGSGILIKKYADSNGTTAFWTNTPSY